MTRMHIGWSDSSESYSRKTGTGMYATGMYAPECMHQESGCMHRNVCTRNQDVCTGMYAPECMHRNVCTGMYAPECMHRNVCTGMMHRNVCTGMYVPEWCTRMMHRNVCAGMYAPECMHRNVCTAMYETVCMHRNVCTAMYAPHRVVYPPWVVEANPPMFYVGIMAWYMHYAYHKITSRRVGARRNDQSPQ